MSAGARRVATTSARHEPGSPEDPQPVHKQGLKGEAAGRSQAGAHPSASDWRYGAAMALFSRAVIVFVAYAAHRFYAPSAPRGLGLEIWRHWDANIILGIASHGYGPQADAHPTAFFPLVPLLVRAVSATGLPVIVAGLLVNALACTVAFSYLCHLVRRELGSTQPGQRAVLYLAFFPTAVFLVAPYTEAVFLAGAVAAFSYARSRHWGLIGLPAAIAVGSRLMGLTLLAGLAVEFLSQKDFRPKRVALAAAGLALGALPFLLFAAYLWNTRGTPLYFLTDQRLGWGRSYVGPLSSLRTTLNAAHWAGYGSGYLLAMRLEVVAAALGLVFTGWALARREFGYATFMGLTMAGLLTSSWYYSVPRALLSLFPVAILLAVFTRGGTHRHDVVLLTSAAMAIFGTVAFATGAWFF